MVGNHVVCRIVMTLHIEVIKSMNSIPEFHNAVISCMNIVRSLLVVQKMFTVSFKEIMFDMESGLKKTLKIRECRWISFLFLHL